MFRTTFINIFKETWPMILICSVIIVSMRIVYLVKENKNFVFYKEILSLSFIIYIMCLFYVVTFQDVSWSSSNFIPFKEMFRYQAFSKMFVKNVIGNMIMFMPYGFFVTYFLKLKKIKSIIFLSLIASFTIEITQLLIGRVFDVDDMLLNMIGSISGFIICNFAFCLKEKIPSFLKKIYIYNILIVIILLIIIMYLVGVKL